MSLLQKLKPQIEKIKVHKRIMDTNPTERRLNQMTGIIMNPKLSKEVKDKKLRELVAESQVEKLLKQKGVKL